LYVDFWHGGRQVPPCPGGVERLCEVRSWSSPGPEEGGQANRLYLLTDAVCRYFNTGGDWQEIAELLRCLARFIPGGLQFPDYHYLSGGVNTTGAYEHVFRHKDGSRHVLWVEDGFIRAATQRELDDDVAQVQPRRDRAPVQRPSSEPELRFGRRTPPELSAPECY
jgi:hypothetical protein